MHTTYYKRWGLFMKNPLWCNYLKKMYQDGFQKIAYLTNQDNPFDQPNFTALLSGCHGETTAETFAQFIFSKNPTTKLYILDINPISIERCKAVLPKKFPNKTIVFLQENILGNSIPDNTIDYIETDGFLQFFEPKTQLPKLIAEWKRMLKPTGFITTRDIVTTNVIGRTIVAIMQFLAKHVFAITIYHQTLAEIEKLYFQYGFYSVVRKTWFPTFRQFTIIKKSLQGTKNKLE